MEINIDRVVAYFGETGGFYLDRPNPTAQLTATYTSEGKNRTAPPKNDQFWLQINVPLDEQTYLRLARHARGEPIDPPPPPEPADQFRGDPS